MMLLLKEVRSFPKILVPNTLYVLDYSLLQELKDSFMHAFFFLSHDDAFIADTLADR